MKCANVIQLMKLSIPLNLFVIFFIEWKKKISIDICHSNPTRGRKLLLFYLQATTELKLTTLENMWVSFPSKIAMEILFYYFLFTSTRFHFRIRHGWTWSSEDFQQNHLQATWTKCAERRGYKKDCLWARTVGWSGTNFSRNWNSIRKGHHPSTGVFEYVYPLIFKLIIIKKGVENVLLIFNKIANFVLKFKI